ncbi:TetR/AcrR family transcriptional regulator (plasmid) [Nitratireductor rhodophyticola]|jgi:AcrR family transcriptional regulator|uniref:TetR/AcrR family transcriptional regulator n=1 Tax=Hyphomicrobiales TaxID=356 RepID=UPI000CA71E64|nr:MULTISPECIES: TetR/AcrR family transcriptional regulator [Hyphomicrobiales]PKP72342.1 MAG: TetR family transcriptional regulator [Alphaproteobacteria bacterium HGW-Alphaproteobacteria-5]TAJ28601.1 MAG: TetR/AcrR family transcriptional regulator [Bosea sp. (in: a-proteobacteria)]WPZ16459.1 TetR/AcrR family transcriptional regulator [Nitratireductor rhodophyticola]
MQKERVRRQGRPPTMENARGKILDEAAELFAHEGFDGASLGSVAEAVGVTKAAIYHYFPNKKEIYEAIIVRTLQGLLDAVTMAVDGQHDAPEALCRFMTAHADYFETHYHGFVTMLVGYGGMENNGLLEEAQDLRDAYEELLRSIVLAGIANGRYRNTDSRAISRAILSMLNWMVRWFKPGHGRPASSFAMEYCEIILNGLGTNGQAMDHDKRQEPSDRRRGYENASIIKRAADPVGDSVSQQHPVNWKRN